MCFLLSFAVAAAATIVCVGMRDSVENENKSFFALATLFFLFLFQRTNNVRSHQLASSEKTADTYIYIQVCSMLYTFLSASRNIKGNGKAQKKRLKNIPNEETTI